MQLRQYQLDAISGLRQAFLQGHRSALLVMPTGAGKTACFTSMAASATAKQKRTLILVHRRELINQASSKLNLLGVNHGIIAAGFEPSSHNVQVASVQTLVRRLNKIDFKPDLLIVDEAHHAVAGSWDTIIKHFSDALLVGVTATPERLDGRGLGTHFQSLVIGPYVDQLVADGYLSSHKVFAPPIGVNLSKVKMRGGDYAKDELGEIMDKPAITGCAVAHYKRLADGLPAIAFCVNVAHAQSVCNSFVDAGYRAKLVTGEMPMDQRDEAISGLADGRTQILCSVDVVSEGTDVPAVSCAILLRPTASTSLYMQQVGRVLRPQPGKVAIIIDHVNSTRKHGFVDDRRSWSLDSKAKRQRKDEPAPSVRQCPECFAAFKPQPICPCCGHVFETKEGGILNLKGDLQELRKEQARERRQFKAEQAKARTLDELLALAARKGYKPGWAYRIYHGRRR
jgi:superfamily II DNA or RNA helicase